MSQIGLTNLSKQEKFLCYSVDYTEATLNRISYRHLSRSLNLHFRDRRGSSALLRYRNCAEITVPKCGQKSYPVWFLCWRKRLLPMNIAKSTLPAETGDLRNICANPTGWPDTF